MRSKLKLNIEQLEVESFPIQEVAVERGTVHGFVSLPQACVSEDGGYTCNDSCNYGSCNGTCEYTCDRTCGWSCEFTCNYTCDATCNYTCQASCWNCGPTDTQTW